MSHDAVASAELGDLAATALRDAQSPQLEQRLRAALALLDKLTLAPQGFGPADLEAARAGGLDAAGCRDAAYVGVVFAVYNRLADALDFRAQSGRDHASSVRHLLQRGYGSTRVPGWVGPGEPAPLPGVVDPYAAAVRWLTRSVLETPGALPTPVRQAALEGGALPAELAPLAAKVRAQASTVSDEDVAAACAARGEAAVFELIVACSVGAALDRRRALWAALAQAGAAEVRA